MKDVTAAAAAIGMQVDVVRASVSREIEVAFATLVRNRVDALLVGSDSLFTSRRLQLAMPLSRTQQPAADLCWAAGVGAGERARRSHNRDGKIV
jgi:hypothetical protein